MSNNDIIGYQSSKSVTMNLICSIILYIHLNELIQKKKKDNFFKAYLLLDFFMFQKQKSPPHHLLTMTAGVKK